FLREFRDESGVVYRSTRKSVEQTADNLRKMGFNAAAYHAGMTDEERARIQDAFANDEIPIIVATIAFGMGIDKSNVRFVVHGDLPRDIESYYQETGRAGRDGAPARCLLLYGWQDVALQRRFLQDYEDPRARAAASARLEEMIRFVEADGCRRANLLRYFGEEYKPPETALDDEEDARDRSAVRSCGACDFCVGDCARIDATIDAQKALSAMQRTGNRFGASHVVDVLLGKETERIKNLGHDRLPTFGVGANRTRRFWKRLIQSMLAQGVAVLAPSELPIPQVSDAGWDVMRGKRKFEILDRPENDEKKERRTRERRSNALDDKASLDVDDRRLFEALRAKRREIAMKEGTPPYVVFTDKTLVDMTRLKPQTDDDFLLVQGVGRAKLRAYGRTFMTVVRKFLEENGGGDE
ncbi:MAG: ATP-dependent DNA helicase RecQ, partial [Thermoguttaceae bacterium]|nr:ATP-dependent DNA helicase RecQ [Thermoguttaceae bacterium]